MPRGHVENARQRLQDLLAGADIVSDQASKPFSQGSDAASRTRGLI
jgi:hypothetical protein